MLSFLEHIFRPRVPNGSNFYHYHTGAVFLPGAGNAVFEGPKLPLVQLIGNAIICGSAPNPYHSQLISSQASQVAGVGGVLAGQLLTQPLQVPETTNGSQ